MKKVTNIVYTSLFILMLTVLPGSNIFGQGGPDDFTDGGNDAPIDGGLSILLAAGVAYGAKKGYDKRKKHK
jgi:hypothetical protein